MFINIVLALAIILYIIALLSDRNFTACLIFCFLLDRKEYKAYKEIKKEDKLVFIKSEEFYNSFINLESGYYIIEDEQYVVYLNNRVVNVVITMPIIIKKLKTKYIK